MPKRIGGLGLHALKRWRVSLAARTAFRFLARDGSLLIQTLVAKYGGRINRFSTRPGDSWSWRLVCLGGQEAVDNSFWKIGNGDKVHVFSDPWVSTTALSVWPTYVCMDHSFIWPVTVSGFLNTNGQWDENLLRLAFGEELVWRILRLARVDEGEADQLVWSLSEDVKPITSLLYGKSFGSFVSPGSWCWKIRGQPKHILFLWRVCRFAVPTATWFADRGISSSLTCPWGCPAMETLDHVLCSCSFARSVWALASSDIQSSWQPSCIYDIISFLESGVRRDRRNPLLASIAALLYFIWRARNDKLHNNIRPSARLVVLSALAPLHSGTLMPLPGHWDSPGLFDPVNPPSIWNPPPHGWIKANFDAAARHVDEGSMACVIRNHQGGLLRADGLRATSQAVAVLELRAAWLAVSVGSVWASCVEGIILEGDSTVGIHSIHQAIAGGNSDSTASEIASLLRGFRDFEVRHVYREANRAANWVAHTALLQDLCWEGAFSAPPALHRILVEDVDRP